MWLRPFPIYIFRCFFFPSLFLSLFFNDVPWHFRFCLLVLHTRFLLRFFLLLTFSSYQRKNNIKTVQVIYFFCLLSYFCSPVYLRLLNRWIFFQLCFVPYPGKVWLFIALNHGVREKVKRTHLQGWICSKQVEFINEEYNSHLLIKG